MKFKVDVDGIIDELVEQVSKDLEGLEVDVERIEQGSYIYAASAIEKVGRILHDSHLRSVLLLAVNVQIHNAAEDLDRQHHEEVEGDAIDRDTLRREDEELLS